jgi:hypothetical protein
MRFLLDINADNNLNNNFFGKHSLIHSKSRSAGSTGSARSVPRVCRPTGIPPYVIRHIGKPKVPHIVPKNVNFPQKNGREMPAGTNGQITAVDSILIN